MKPKTKAFANELLANPKLSNTEAYLRTHETTNRNSAKASASKLLSTPVVSIYMAKHVSNASKRIAYLVDNASKEEIQLRASQDVLDREYGKPRQQIDHKSEAVYFSIDLSSSLAELE